MMPSIHHWPKSRCYFLQQNDETKNMPTDGRGPKKGQERQSRYESLAGRSGSQTSREGSVTDLTNSPNAFDAGGLQHVFDLVGLPKFQRDEILAKKAARAAASPEKNIPGREGADMTAWDIIGLRFPPGEPQDNYLIKFLVFFIGFLLTATVLILAAAAVITLVTGTGTSPFEVFDSLSSLSQVAQSFIYAGAGIISAAVGAKVVEFIFAPSSAPASSSFDLELGANSIPDLSDQAAAKAAAKAGAKAAATAAATAAGEREPQPPSMSITG
jgi:hypothetical protein